MFTRLVKRKTARPSFNLHQECHDTQLTHLLFADDVVLFCRGDIGSVETLKTCLDQFGDISGLRVNRAKSAIFFGSVDEGVKTQILEHTGYREGAFPFRYLGVPISPHKLTSMEFQPLLNKISSYITFWARRSLSFAGKRELIASVPQGSAGFWLSIFSVPGDVIKRLVAMCRNFLWKKPRVKWSMITAPREEGGLGLLDLTSWNKACMAKYLWHNKDRRDSLWVRWFYHHHLGV